MKLIVKGKEMFYFSCTFHEKDVPKQAGFFWNATLKMWETKSLEKALKLSAHADDENLNKLIQLQKKEKEVIISSSKIDSEIELICKEGKDYFPFQKAGIEYALNKDNVLIADEMGLGKTIQAIGILNNSDLNQILIVCPSSLRINWKREIESWLSKDLSIGIIEKSNQKIIKKDILIVSYDLMSKVKDQLKNIDFDTIIIDECHYIKNYKAQRTKAVLDIASKIKKKILLTGTPVLNRPAELYTTVNLLGWNISWKSFMIRYAAGHETKFGWDTTGASNLEELQKNLRAKFMIRRLKADVLKDLPAKTRQVILLPQNGMASKLKEDKKIYESLSELKSLESVHFEEISKRRHQSAVLKTDAIINHLTELLETGQKIVFFAHHKEILEKVYEEFKDIAVILTGSSNMFERDTAVKSFQDCNSIRLFVGSIQAAGVGLTLTASSTVVFGELDWVPATMAQAEDRCHRIGQKDNVLIQYLVFEYSIDALLAQKIVEKIEIIKEALDEPIKL